MNAAPANQPATYNLNAGQYLQLTQDAELTGSAILANNPIGVWGGATCLNIDVGDVACDSAHQQFFPVAALGNEYVGVRYRNRGRAPTRTLAVAHRRRGRRHELSYEPSTPAGAPLALNRGQVGEFKAAGPFVVKSQDVRASFLRLRAHDRRRQRVTPVGRGDPEFVNVVPPAEYLASYVFFTDPTYPETNLVVVRTKGANGFADVNLDCAGKLVRVGSRSVRRASTSTFAPDLVSGKFREGRQLRQRSSRRSPAPSRLD